MANSLILWVVIGGIALAVDIATSSFLFVWFTVGAIAAIITQIFDYSFMAQLINFVWISGVSMVIGYPIVKKTIKNSVKPTPVREETYIGEVLTVDSDMIQEGKVRLDGVYWQVLNVGEVIEEGDEVKVIEVRGNKIVITKNEESSI